MIWLRKCERVRTYSPERLQMVSDGKLRRLIGRVRSKIEAQPELAGATKLSCSSSLRSSIAFAEANAPRLQCSELGSAISSVPCPLRVRS